MRNQLENLQSEYLESLVSGLSPFEEQCREAAEKLGLAGISLSRAEASLLRWLTQSKPVNKAVEIGTLTGLSGLFILDGLAAGGKLWALEKNEAHVALAEPILKSFAALQEKRVEVLLGDARVTLTKLGSEGPFDFVFIDGNKAAYGDYLTWCEQNLKKGGLLVADNVFLSGAVYEPGQSKFSAKQIDVMKAFNKRLSDRAVWRSALIPTSEGLFVAEKLV